MEMKEERGFAKKKIKSLRCIRSQLYAEKLLSVKLPRA